MSRRAEIRSLGGFTLIEILVAVAILTTILSLSTTVIGGIEKTIRSSKRTRSALEQGRMILDLIQQDMEGMLVRSDMAYRLIDRPLSESTDSFFGFYTDVITPARDFSDNRMISTVAYGFRESEQSHRTIFTRSAKALSRRQNQYFGLHFIRNGEYQITPYSAPDHQDGVDLRPGLVRLGLEYQVRAMPDLPSKFKGGGIYKNYPTREGSILQNKADDFDPRFVHSILVQMVICDEEAARAAPPEVWDQYIHLYSEKNCSPSQLYMDHWNEILQSETESEPIKKLKRSTKLLYRSMVLQNNFIPKEKDY